LEGTINTPSEGTKITCKTKQPYQTKEVKKWDQEVMHHDVVTYDKKRKSSIIAKGAGEFGSLPNHKGCQCNTIESKAGQSHCTCHQKGVLDIAYLTIHMDAGAMAFT
jgi:hypothetical protein